MSLSALQEQWIQLCDELGESFNSQVMAAPFVSVQEDSNEGTPVRPILLVGKATAGNWCKDSFDSFRDKPLIDRLKERRNATLAHLELRKKGDLKPSAFWCFRDGLAQISEPVIWTNLVKIGVEKRNPHWRFVQRQSELAHRTLVAEMEEYKPALVVLVTSIYAAQEISHPVFGPKDIWKKSPDDSIWWQERTQTEPPILWVDHPGFKLKNELDRWLKKARELIS
jgi:hypothetical protein